MVLRSVLKDNLKLKIVRFFNENRSSIDTPRGIATWVNADIEKAEEALEELVRDELLVYHGEGSTRAYGYTHDREKVKEVERYLKEICGIE